MDKHSDILSTGVLCIVRLVASCVRHLSVRTLMESQDLAPIPGNRRIILICHDLSASSRGPAPVLPVEAGEACLPFPIGGHSDFPLNLRRVAHNPRKHWPPKSPRCSQRHSSKMHVCCPYLNTHTHTPSVLPVTSYD